MWFEGSTAIDENGEPIITEFDGDRVFVSDPEYDSTKELTELDTSKIKSVDNTGSFPLLIVEQRDQSQMNHCSIT